MIQISQSGQILGLLLVALFVVLGGVLIIIGGSRLYFETSNYNISSEAALNLAEAGIDKTVASLNKLGGNYTPEQETFLGNGSYSVTVTTKDTATKIITSTGYIPNKSNPKAKRTVKIQISQGIGVSFVYGVQVGEGGLQLGNSNQVIGSVYSNGSISGGNGNVITGDVWIAGGTQTTPDQTTDCSGSNCEDFLFGKKISGDDKLDVAQSFKLSTSGILNKVSLKLKKIGSPANSTVRILQDSSGVPDKNNVLTSGTLSSSLITSIYGWTEATFTSSPLLLANTPYWVIISTSSDSKNYFSWQNDLAQSYNRGLPKWSPNWAAGNPNWNNISGDLSFQVFMGGGQTKLSASNNFTVGKDVHANTIENITIQKDAYYQNLINTTVSGTKYSGSPDPPPKPFPLSAANIAEWKQKAGKCDSNLNNCQNVSTGNITSCVSLESKKYAGNITFNSNCDITAASPIWISGNFTINTNNTVKLEPSYGPISGVIIVDGIISLGSNNHVEGSGVGSSVLLLLSTYDSINSGVSAIQLSNTGNVVVLYADKGIIEPGNSNHFKELTAWGIKLVNNGEITYDTGLSSSLFSSGPSGTFSLIKGTYKAE